MDLFDDSDNDEGITINKRFADQYESTERKKELARSKYILEDNDNESDDSSSEEEDDDGDLIDPSLDIQIINTINSIRKKDPKIYDKTSTWFSHEESGENDEDDSDGEANDATIDNGEETSKSKKKHFKDVIREQLLQHGPDIEEGGDDVRGRHEVGTTRHRSTLAYNAEQESLRKAFLKSVADGDQGIT